jgi:hypothetical protein
MIRAEEPQSGPEHLQRSSCSVEVSRGVAPRTEGSLADPEDVGDHRRSGGRTQGLRVARCAGDVALLRAGSPHQST